MKRSSSAEFFGGEAGEKDPPRGGYEAKLNRRIFGGEAGEKDPPERVKG
jgi:hypothetical protein